MSYHKKSYSKASWSRSSTAPSGAQSQAPGCKRAQIPQEDDKLSLTKIPDEQIIVSGQIIEQIVPTILMVERTDSLVLDVHH